MNAAIANLRRKQAARRNRRNRDRAILAAAQWLGMACLSLCSIPAAVLIGMAMAESARLIGAH